MKKFLASVLALAVFSLCATAGAQTSVQEWQPKAVEKYPALGEKDSAFNKAFLAEYEKLLKTSPEMFREPDWPMQIANRVAFESRTAQQDVQANPIAPKTGSPSPLTDSEIRTGTSQAAQQARTDRLSAEYAANNGPDLSTGSNSHQLKGTSDGNLATPENSPPPPASPMAATLEKVPIPAQGTYLGAATSTKFSDFEQLINKPLAIQYIAFTDIVNFSKGDATSNTTLGAILRVNSNHDVIPMVTLYHTNRTLAEILTNKIDPKDSRPNSATLPDDFARGWARGLKAYGKPVFFRWNHEMNGNWIYYCTDGKSPKSFDRDTATKQNPGDYVAAWKHFHDIFVQEGATNVSWVWCPEVANASSYAKLYPGDDYVDWTGLDGYNWFPRDPRWRSFSDVFLGSYRSILKIAPSKPFLIAEFNCTKGTAPDGRQMAAWFTQAATEIPTKFPNLKALLLFNFNAVGEQDWRIENYPVCLKAFSRAFSRDYFLSGPPLKK